MCQQREGFLKGVILTAPLFAYKRKVTAFEKLKLKA
jgi:hypothetical protein